MYVIFTLNYRVFNQRLEKQAVGFDKMMNNAPSPSPPPPSGMSECCNLTQKRPRALLYNQHKKWEVTALERLTSHIEQPHTKTETRVAYDNRPKIAPRGAPQTLKAGGVAVTGKTTQGWVAVPPGPPQWGTAD